MHWLTRRLESARVVEPRTDGEPVIFFGATVEVEDEDGARATYRIVGEDEIDLDKGLVKTKRGVLEAAPLPPFLQEIVRSGGLVGYYRSRKGVQ
jgi:hypothetical protein